MTVQLFHLLNTNTITNAYTDRVPYDNNTSNHIDANVITYSTHNSITIVTYSSSNYDNNSIYINILTLTDTNISGNYTYANV